MRRALALAVLLNIAFLSSGMTLVRRGGSCCCAMKKGASCPLRKRCTMSQSWSLSQDVSAAFQQQAPRVIVEAAKSLRSASDVQPIARWTAVPCSGALMPPEPPPPRTA